MGLKKRKYGFFRSATEIIAEAEKLGDDYIYRRVPVSEPLDSHNIDYGLGCDLEDSKKADFDATPIIDIDGYVHVVINKVICFSADEFDVTDWGDVICLGNIANCYFERGDNDSIAILRCDKVTGKKMIESKKLDSLSESVQMKVKEAISVNMDYMRMRYPGIYE